MPLLRRQPFVKQKPPPDLGLDDEVFHCKLTNEIFQDYDEFFERIILCNSLVWTCALTGRSGLTYQEALDCEEKAKKRLSSFPDYIQKPILFLVTLTHRSRLNDLNDDIFVFMRDRYFIGEVVEVTFDGEKKNCRIQKVLPMGAVEKSKINGAGPITVDTDSDSDVICLDDLPPEDKQEEIKKSPPKDHEKSAALGADPSTYQYVVQELKKGHPYTVKAGQINRKKGLYTRDKSKLYLKQHCDPIGDGIWKVKEKFIKKFKLNELRFSDIYNGPLPNFKQSVAKKIPKDKSKKFEKLQKEKLKKGGDSGVKRGRPKKGEESPTKKKNREMGLPDVETLAKMSTEERLAFKAKLKEEKRLAKLAEKEKMKEQHEAEKLKAKEQRLAEKEKQKEEKLLQEAILREWSRPREDMELDDLQDMPIPEPVKLNVSVDLFGDLVMVLEYLHCFNSLFDVKDQFPDEISVQGLCDSLNSTDTNSLYFDLLKFLLLAIFNLQQEEHDEEEELQKEHRLVEPLTATDSMSRQDFVKNANISSQLPLHNLGCSLNKLQLDAFTVSEVLRLHFLGSGAEMNVEDAKFCYQERGGYTCLDDAGLEFCRQEPEIINALGSGSVFDLPTGDKLKVLTVLINQLLTFVACRDFMEDNFEQMLQVRRELRSHQWAEQKRERDEAAFWTKKRSEDRAKQRQIEAEERMEKMKAREERLRIEEFRKRAKEEKKDLKQLLTDGGHDDLLERLKKDAEKSNAASDSQQNASAQKNDEEEGKAAESAEPVEPERRSERRKVKSKAQAEPEEEIPLENIDWEKLTPADRRKWRDIYERKEREFQDSITELQSTYQIIPLGRDRTFRRYWIFPNLPGLFIEDDERHIPDDYLTPIEQKVPEAKMDRLGNNPADLSGEAKSICSDKENQSPKNNKDNISEDVVMTNNENNVLLDDNKSQVVSQGVHEQCAQFGNVRWAYVSTEEQLDQLIDSLNTRGLREGPLKTTLREMRPRLLDSIKAAPTDMLQMSDNGSTKVVKVQNIKGRNRIMQGVVENASSREFLELNLREMLLDLEDRIYAGSLGWIKIKSRPAWRDAIENGSYDPQTEDIVTSSQQWEEERMETGDDDLNDSMTVKESAVAHDLARALLQIKNAVDPKYLTQPLGSAEDTTSRSRGQNKKAEKQVKKEETDEDEDDSKPKLKPFPERWEESLLSCQSVSQVFLHLTVVERSVLWSKSALNARCRLCRRKGDAEKMLLCDGCDRGHHMFCLKPPVKHVPKGNWYCPDCKPKEIMRTPRKNRRASTFREESSDEEEEASSSDSSDSSDGEEAENSSDEEEENEVDSDDDEEKADSDDSDDNSESGSDSDDDGDSSEEGSPDSDDEDGSNSESGSPDSEEETKKQPAKIKIGASAKKKKPSSGRSSPTSGRSSRNTTRESTPVDKHPRARKRLSLNDHSEGPPAKKAAVRSRLSAETANKSNSRSRRSVENTNARSRSETRKSQEPEEMSGTTSKARGGQKAAQLKACESLIEDLMEHDDAWPFLAPVTKKDAPDYFAIVKRPMDFGTLKCNIKKFEYSEPTSILEDIRLVFTNCEKYNVPSAEEYVAGQRLCRYFVRRVKELKLDVVLAQSANGVNGAEKGKKKSPEVTTRRSRRSNP